MKFQKFKRRVSKVTIKSTELQAPKFKPFHKKRIFSRQCIELADIGKTEGISFYKEETFPAETGIIPEQEIASDAKKLLRKDLQENLFQL